jgi:mRNA-degrading endonuclease RelE of RelBE toxin-antitoxin system
MTNGFAPCAGIACISTFPRRRNDDPFRDCACDHARIAALGLSNASKRNVAYQVNFSSLSIRAQAAEPEVRGYVDLLGADPRLPGARQVGEAGRFELWRLRAGDTRILYRIDDQAKTVTIIGVTRRQEPYPT